MDWDTWAKFYKRLLSAYGKTPNGEQMAAYYEALSQFSQSLVEQAVTVTIESHKTWPSAAELCERCRMLISAKPYARSACDVCHGDLWVRAPDQEHFGRTYTGYVQRCPQCFPNAKKREVA